MALEMRHGKVAFVWDSGSGHTKLEFPNLQINNNKWHRINATRFVLHFVFFATCSSSATQRHLKS